MKSANTRYLWLILFIFGTIYALISLVNHYCFRTYALDLGLYTHALHEYAHLRMPDTGLFKQSIEPLLADHFDLYLILFSPLSFIFGSYTLLVIQIVAVLYGAAGVYRYLELKAPGNSLIPLAATICFLSFFGVFSAVAYDYHSNTVAAMLLPWLLFFFEKRKIMISFFFLVLILIAKENMALWMLFICLGLMIESRKDKRSLAWLSAFSLISILYFIIIVQFIMPALSHSGTYHGFLYSVIGENPWEALKNIIIHPIDAVRTLFTNHSGNPRGDFVKAEFHILVLVSGLYLLLLKPAWFVMLIPLYFQKMFHDNIQMWSISGQYAVEFAPVLIIGVFSAITRFRQRNIQVFLTILVFIGIILSTIRVMDRTVFYTNKSMIRFYQEIHYKRNYDVSEVHRLLMGLPEEAAISAQSPFLPHLALREKIYQFPIIRDAIYIVYSLNEGTYPLNENDFNKLIEELKSSDHWDIHFQSDELVILKRMD